MCAMLLLYGEAGALLVAKAEPLTVKESITAKNELLQMFIILSFCICESGSFGNSVEK
jgi:hypothetical protein